MHVGHDRSFVYDIADLYKTEIAVPVAFEVISRAGVEDISAETRRAMRDKMFEAKLLTRCVRDIYRVLGADGGDDETYGWDVLELWDDKLGTVEAGKSWGEAPPW